MNIHESRPWTLEQVAQLRELAAERVPVRLIALKLKRSEADVHAKVAELGLSVSQFAAG